MTIEQKLKLIVIVFIFGNNYLYGSGALKDSLPLQYFSCHFTTQNGLPSNEIYSIINDNRGYIWIGTDRGIAKYDGYSFSVFTQADGITDNVIFDIFEDSTGMLWFGTLNKKICTYTEKAGFAPFKYNHVIDSLTVGIPFFGSKVYVDSLENIIIQDYREQYIIIDKSGKGEIKNYQRNGDLTINNIKLGKQKLTLKDALLASKSGIGIDFIDNIQEIINNEPICQVASDNDGGIWLATLNSGVYYFPSSYIEIVDSPLKIRGLIPQGYSISYATEKDYYVLTKNNSFLKNIVHDTLLLNKLKASKNVNRIEQQSYKFYNHLRFSNSFPGNIWGVQVEENNQIISWGTQSIDFSNHHETFRSNQRITSFYSLGKKEYLVGTLYGLYTLSNKKLKKHVFNFGTIDTRVQDIKYDKQHDILYVATLGNGLYVIKQDSLADHLYIKDGLNSNSINQLCLDADNTLWIATNNGVNYLRYSNESVLINKLLPSDRYYNSQNVSQVLVRDSIIHIGTDYGIGIVDQRFINHNPIDRFPLYILSTFINDKETSIDKLNNSYLDYEKNNVKIKYLGLSLAKFGDITYRYRLLGEHNEDWTITTETTATFQNLLPGEYHFEVQCQNKFNDWINTDTTLSFVINKPFWKAIWFIIFSALLFSAIVFLIFYKYYDAQKKRSSLINELNNTKQMAITTQLNPHFVFNSLNSIQNFILKNEKNLSNAYLGKFSLLMRKIFENSTELYISLQDELDAVNAYFELENVRHNNSIIFESNIQLTESTEILKIPSLILQPIIENAINHGIIHLNKPGVITVEIKDDENHLFIKISDNGKGRAYSKTIKRNLNHKSGGIKLTSKRLALLSKQFKKQASMKTIDLVDSNGNPLGTRVELTIPKIYENKKAN